MNVFCTRFFRPRRQLNEVKRLLGICPYTNKSEARPHLDHEHVIDERVKGIVEGFSSRSRTRQGNKLFLVRSSDQSPHLLEKDALSCDTKPFIRDPTSVRCAPDTRQTLRHPLQRLRPSCPTCGLHVLTSAPSSRERSCQKWEHGKHTESYI
jgi:hypothetical protein